jgi:hypothetical protein
MTSIRRQIVRLLLLCVLYPSPFVHGQTFDYTTGKLGTRLWVPPDVSTIKGIVIYGNGADSDFRTVTDSAFLQEFGELYGFGVIGTSMWSNLSTSAEVNSWSTHLQGLATASGHPELVNAPWVTLGFSNGGSMAYALNSLWPEKTIAFATNKGCCYNNRAPSVAAIKTPGLLISGELDTVERHNSIKGLFDTNRPRGAEWSWAEQQGAAHEDGVEEYILPFLAEAIRVRYPAGQSPTAAHGVSLLPVNESDGWLADQSTWKSGLTKVFPYDAYAGNKLQAGWLLNQNVAALYRAFSTYDPVPLHFELGFDYPYHELLVQSPLDLPLTLDATGMAGWTKIEILNYGSTVLTLTPDQFTGNLLTFPVPIPQGGMYAFSALVTHADGVTQSSTNLLSVTAIGSVPEPATSTCVMIGIATLMTTSPWRKGRRQSKRPPNPYLSTLLG